VSAGRVEPPNATELADASRVPVHRTAPHPPLELAPEEYAQLVPLILEAEKEGVVTRTFRRLDPEQQVAIIDAVLTELVEMGNSGATMRRIADRLGLSVASLYGYFPDRDAMLEFAARAASRVIVFTAWDDWKAPASTSLPEDLVRYLSDDVDFSQRHWSMVALLAQSAYRGEGRVIAGAAESVAAGMRSHLQALLDHARDRGELREALDAEATGVVVYALLTVLADARFYGHLNEYLHLFTDDDGLSPERVQAAALSMITRGICRTV
jgi:AcrR family transcriptional regulator